MKRQLAWFFFSLIFACHCAIEGVTELSYEIEEDQFTEDTFRVSDFTENAFSEEEDLFAYEEWFTTPLSVEEMVTVSHNNPADDATFAYTPAYIPEDHWYSGEFVPRLKIEHTPYSALLYQEDEFGLELLCPGYWIKRGVLLIRIECWRNNIALNMDDTVMDVILNNELNLAMLRLLPQPCSQEHELHLANIRNTLPLSLDDCVLYALQEDYALFENYSWAIRPLTFKRALVLCPIDHICLRSRPSAAYGVDYALLCDNSLVGMLTADRTKYERVFGKLTLVDLTVAEPWINRILEEFKDVDEQQ